MAAAATSTWWALLGLLGLLVVAPVVGAVAGDAKGPALIPVLKMTGIAEFVMGLSFLVGSLLSAGLQ